MAHLGLVIQTESLKLVLQDEHEWMVLRPRFQNRHQLSSHSCAPKTSLQESSSLFHSDRKILVCQLYPQLYLVEHANLGGVEHCFDFTGGHVRVIAGKHCYTLLDGLCEGYELHPATVPQILVGARIEGHGWEDRLNL